MQQQLILPEGGLASFLTSNLDEIDDSRLLFGKQSGINSHRGIAEKMAGFGRNGDTEMIHAEKGEIVIHPKLLEENPRLAQEMMDAFSSSGVNLDRYTVGGEANSINPRTGQAEFFFKKLVKSVKKLVKTVAPIVVPLAVGFFTGGMGLSLMTQGALSGGITSLIQGGNIKDAMKGALMGGAIAGISSGAKGFLDAKKGQGIQGFKSGFMKSAPTFIGGGGKDYQQIMDFNKEVAPTAEVSQAVPFQNAKAPVPPSQVSDVILDVAKTPADPSFRDYLTRGYDKVTGMLKNPPLDLEKAKAQLLTGTDGAQYAALKATDATAFNAAAQDIVAASAANPSYNMYKTVGAGLLAAAPMGLYDTIPEEELEDPYDGTSPSEDRLAENPERYRVGVPDVPYLRATMDDVVVPSQEQLMYEQYLNQPQYAAAGGEMQNFPRRNGYIAGRGTETSDSIPAMLSDGEFVMNARAVRGAGNGSREKGVRKMYDIMRAFEGGAVA